MSALMVIVILYFSIGLTEGWKWRDADHVLPDNNPVINNSTYHIWRLVQMLCIFYLMPFPWYTRLIVVIGCDRFYNRVLCGVEYDDLNHMQPGFYIGITKKLSITIFRWPVWVDWVLVALSFLTLIIFHFAKLGGL